LALHRELAVLVREPAEPRSAYLGTLEELLGKAPDGILLDTLVDAFFRDGSLAGLEALLRTFERDDFSTFTGRPVGKGEAEKRHRIVEMNFLRVGDGMYAKHNPGTPSPALDFALGEDLQAFLEKQLDSANSQRVRCAAYLLGGGQVSPVAPKILAAYKRAKGAWTRAILLEALGRSDPKHGRGTLLKAAGASRALERLAALPFLGVLHGEEVDSSLKKAIADSKWTVRRAALEACARRGDAFAADLLVQRFGKETGRLHYEIFTTLAKITGARIPPKPKEWSRWWEHARKDFRPKTAEGKQAKAASGRTGVLNRGTYFGLEVWSNRLAILFDSSGSMASTQLRLNLSGVGVEGTSSSGSPIVIAKEQIDNLLRAFTKQTKFNLIAYSDGVKALSKKLLPASKGNLRKAGKYLKGIEAKGETNLYGALAKALTDPAVDTIYVLSDGEPTRGIRIEPTDIQEAVARANRFRKTVIHAVQIGRDLQLLKNLARQSGGRYRNVTVGATQDGRSGG